MNSKLTKALQVLARTVETGSMSQAALQLNMTASAVSQQIAKLEQDIGLSLFNRSTRKQTLTEAGQIYYTTAKQLLATAEEAQRQLERLQNTPSGQLKLIAPIGFGGGLLSRPIKQLIEEFGEIEIDLTLTDDPVDVIATGADLAICIGPLSSSNLIARHLAKWDLIMCVDHQHPLATKGCNHPDHLQSYSYVGHNNVSRRFTQMTHLPSGASTTLNAPRVRVNNMQAVIQLTLDGFGYALLPEPEVRHHLRSGKLVQLMPDWHMGSYDVYAVTPQRDSIAAKTQAAIVNLRSWFDDVSSNSISA